MLAMHGAVTTVQIVETVAVWVKNGGCCVDVPKKKKKKKKKTTKTTTKEGGGGRCMQTFPILSLVAGTGGGWSWSRGGRVAQ